MLRTLLVLATLTLAACSDPTSPDNPLVAKLTATSYELGTIGVASVPFRVDNEGKRMVPLQTCGAQVKPVIERYNGRSWESYGGGRCPTIYVVEAEPLEPGTGRGDIARLTEAGRFRLRFSTGEGYLYSPAFDVK